MRQGAHYLKTARGPETLEQLFNSERDRMLRDLGAAFQSETGLSAQEMELVEEDCGTFRRWFYRQREGAERLCEPVSRVAPSQFWLSLLDLRDCLRDESIRLEIAGELRGDTRKRALLEHLYQLLAAIDAETKWTDS